MDDGPNKVLVLNTLQGETPRKRGHYNLIVIMKGDLSPYYIIII